MMVIINRGGGGMEPMGRHQLLSLMVVAKTPSPLQPSTAVADRGGEEVRWPLYRAAVDRPAANGHRHCLPA